MTLILADLEAVAELEAMVNEWSAAPYRIGLYAGDPLLSHTAVYADVTPCPTPGADALVDLNAWGAVALVDSAALVQHALAVWTCTGAGPQTMVGGVYVVTPGFRLAWVERFRDGPILVGATGQVVAFLPRRTHRSQLLQG